MGTPEAYWEAHQDLIRGDGVELADADWPIRTSGGHQPPARLTRSGTVHDSLISPASVVAGQVVDSVLCPGVVVEEGAVVDRAVVLDQAVIRAGAHVEQAIVDAGADVGSDAMARGGADPENPIAVVGADR